MSKLNTLLGSTALSVVLAAGALVAPGISAAADAKMVDEGKALAFDRKKGNCLACHNIPGGVSPGNIGPPLVAMKARFPDSKKLYDKIWEAQVSNPESPMPPFGKHGALSKAEIEKIIAFLMTI